jgi:hypothetical protein
MVKETSVKQAAARMLNGHAQALYRASKGETLFASYADRSVGELRGCRTLSDTLYKWGAIEGGKITNKGLDILARWREKNQWWRP